MAVEPQVRELIATGRQTEAIALVEREAAAGDNWSLYALAQWLLAGEGMERDPSRATALLERAAAQGMEAATMQLAPLLLTGTGCEEDASRARALLESLRQHGGFVAAQLDLVERVAEPADIAVEEIHAVPDIRIYRQAFDRAETAWIRSLAEPQLQPSFVEDPTTGERRPHPVRTSYGMSFGPASEDLVVARVNRRIARLTGTGRNWGEPLHVLRYAPGQQYRPHFDALPGVANQRQLTAIIFLNSGFEGGETSFPALDITLRAQEGDMLAFANLDENGARDAKSEHAGEPVTSGFKWIATRWIRQRRYHPWETETTR